MKRVTSEEESRKRSTSSDTERFLIVSEWFSNSNEKYLREHYNRWWSAPKRGVCANGCDAKKVHIFYPNAKLHFCFECVEDLVCNIETRELKEFEKKLME